MQHEIENIQQANTENLRDITDTHNSQISEIKKKQWVNNILFFTAEHYCFV